MRRQRVTAPLQAPKPVPQDEVDEITQQIKHMCRAFNVDGSAVTAYSNLQEAQLHTAEFNRLQQDQKHDKRDKKKMTMDLAIQLYVEQALNMDKMWGKIMGLSKKTKKEHEMDAKRLFQDPKKFSEFKEVYENRHGEHTVVKLEWNNVTQPEFHRQATHFAKHVNKALCWNCEDLTKASPAELRKCVRCQKAYYCSKECQKEDWKRHKKACKEAAAKKS